MLKSKLVLLVTVFIIIASMFLASCGCWMIHKTYTPRGGVIGWRTEERAMTYMSGHCGGSFRVVSRWDGYQSHGQYSYTAGDTIQTITLDAGYGYMAFVCTDQN